MESIGGAWIGIWREDWFVSRKPPPDWEKIERNEWLKSRDEVTEELRKNAPRVEEAAASFAERFGYSVESVLDKMGQDEMFAAAFAKQPGRTKLHERVAAEWIAGLPEVSDFISLPTHGKGSIKIDSDGNLRPGAGKEVPGKSLDFQWKSGGKTYYAMHKYTKESGGAQDNQFHEMKELMRRFHHCSDTNITLVVIVDGEYYQRSNRSRLRELKRHQRDRPPISKALPIGELQAFLRAQSSA